MPPLHNSRILTTVLMPALSIALALPDSVSCQIVATPVPTEKKNRSNSTDAAKRLALFPGSRRKKKKKNAENSLSTDSRANPDGSNEPTPSDPRKTALETAIASAIPSDRHYRLILADAIATCYWKNHFKPLWRGKRLPDRLQRALSLQLSQHALPGSMVLDTSAVQSSLGSSQVDRKDLAKTIVIADAGAMVRFGAVDPKKLWPYWDSGDTPGSSDRSASAFARDLLQASKLRPASVEKVIGILGPKSWIYRELQRGYQQSKASILKYSGLPNIPDPAEYGVARAGQAYPYAPALAAHLIDKGYLKMSATQAADTSSLTPDLTAALIAFQKDYGLEADGIMGSSSWLILNSNPADIYRANTINLHRARLIPSYLGDRYVIINLPTAELFGFEKNDSYALNMRIVHGKASKEAHRTPIFRDVMQEVVFGPYWNVPRTIATKELVPKALEEHDYLSRNNYQIVDSFDPDGAKIYQESAETLAQVAAGSLFLRQAPGADNALGHVKFLFPNQFSVYLHDTPSKQFFARSQRDRSHGCIRLSEPNKMAVWTLGSQGWNETKVKNAMNAEKRTSHRVENKVNVYITYFTLFPRPKGNGRYILAPARDVYGLDVVDSKTLGPVISWKQ